MQPNATPRSIAPEKDDEWFACPCCHRIVQGLFCADWCSGLVAIDPALLCGRCVGELREDERAGEIWNFRILSMRGAPLAQRRLVLA